MAGAVGNEVFGLPIAKVVGAQRLEAVLRPMERQAKGFFFDCKMCGQCVLHSTGLTCPMTCPKNLRNGPCGGVRANGRCEVKPDMECVWVKAVRRSHRIPRFGPEIDDVRPPVDWQLQGTGSWENFWSGRDRETPAGWAASEDPGD